MNWALGLLEKLVMNGDYSACGFLVFKWVVSMEQNIVLKYLCFILSISIWWL